MKIFNSVLKTSRWALFLLVLTVGALVLLQQPRSLGEFYSSLFMIDSFQLLLSMICSLIAASIIVLLENQEA